MRGGDVDAVGVVGLPPAGVAIGVVFNAREWFAVNRNGFWLNPVHEKVNRLAGIIIELNRE